MYIAIEHFTEEIPTQIEAPDSAVFYSSVECSPADDGVKVGNMKEIALSQGKFTIIDDADYERVSQFNWYAVNNYGCWYAAKTIRVEGIRTIQRLHKFLLNPPKGQHIDHRNGNGLDNRRANLRFSTSSQNNQNMRKIYGKSGFKGVDIDKQKKRWQSRITVCGKTIQLGTFNTKEEAARAYDGAAIEYFGEFAYTNKMARGDF